MQGRSKPGPRINNRAIGRRFNTSADSQNRSVDENYSEKIKEPNNDRNNIAQHTSYRRSGSQAHRVVPGKNVRIKTSDRRISKRSETLPHKTSTVESKVGQTTLLVPSERRVRIKKSSYASPHHKTTIPIDHRPGARIGSRESTTRAKKRSPTRSRPGFGHPPKKFGGAGKDKPTRDKKQGRRRIYRNSLGEYEGDHNYDSEGESFSSGYEEGLSQKFYLEDNEDEWYWEEEEGEEWLEEEQEWVLSEKDKQTLCKKFAEIYMDIGTQNRIVNEIRRNIRCLLKNIDFDCITICELRQIRALKLCLEMEKLRQLYYLNKAKDFLASTPAGPWDDVAIVTNDLDDYMSSELSCTVSDAIMLSYTENGNSRLLFK